MPDGSGVAAARIGPNALIQLVPILDATHGAAARRALFAACGTPVPDGSAMIDEGPVAAIHRAMRARFPETAPAIARAAGLAVGDYILANRIPAPVQTVLRALPAPLAARALTRAITAHAWTFCGSGHVTARAGHPTVCAIHDNPMVRGETADHGLCHWHTAVFERLFATLVHPCASARETACCAMGAPACRFEIRWRGRTPPPA